MSAVSLSGLGKSFGDTLVLDGVDLDVLDGEILGVLGSSGCGKTTMLRIIAGFLEPSAGSVTIGAEQVAGGGVSVSAQRRRVGYVPQEGALFPHLDVRGNILFGLARRERTPQRLAEMLELAELPEEIATHRPHQLSGGQQQRVALARALAPRPEVVLLDEPFSSLDASLRASAGHAVTRVLRAAGTTALLVTHDEGEALSLSDRVAVMRDGRVVQVAAPVELYRQPADVGVGAFVGGANVLPGRGYGRSVRCALGMLKTKSDLVGDVQVLVRPEQITITDGDDAYVREVTFFGAYATVSLAIGDELVKAQVAAPDAPLSGETVGLVVTDSVGVYR